MNQLSAHLKEVMAGETVVITDRGKPVATLQPVSPAKGRSELSVLCAQGVVSVPREELDLGPFLKLPRGKTGGGLAAAIVEACSER